MADPRGRGFNRGKGKWHAPTREPKAPPDPVGLGWTQVDNEQKWYIGDTFLEPSTTTPGWILIQSGFWWDVKRVFKMFVPDGLLACTTANLLKDEEA